jgi:enoyl-CoA hydratase/carnithine racemase
MSDTLPGQPTQTQRILISKLNGVTTLTMNRPKRLNGWTMEMMDELKAAFQDAAQDDDTKVLVLTGSDPYYCAGVNLGGTLKLGHPQNLHDMIVEHNQGLFEAFLAFPKPFLVAANGPAIGAAVTSATLCDAIIASDKATFSTPFAALGVCPEGCSSVHFERLMGQRNAERMLGEDGWKPTAAEALAAGLVQHAVPHDTLLTEAQKLAEQWIKDGATRKFRGPGELEELKAVNARESVGVADSFLSAPFMQAQFKFLWSKNKRAPATMFFTMWALRPLWSRLLSK